MKHYKSFDELKSDVDNGIPVYWMHKGYVVIKEKHGDEYGILFTRNGNYVGLKSCANIKAYFSE